MPGLKPRTIHLTVSDHREVSPEDQHSTEENLTLAFAEVFGRQEIQLETKSPNMLSVTVSRPSKATNGVDPESCVEMVGVLTGADGRSLRMETFACAEFRNVFGMSYGSYLSGAFQHAADMLLQQLEEAGAAAVDPLEFESTRIQLAAFREQGLSALRVTVEDEFSQDGSLGRNLQTALEAAFLEEGVQLDERSLQTFLVTLYHPTEDLAGHDKRSCLSIEARVQLERGTAFASRTACRGWTETNHHQVLNDTIQSLWSAYTRLPVK